MQVDVGLVEHEQLVGHERPAQLGVEGGVEGILALGIALEDAEGVAAHGLRAVHGLVGVAQQLVVGRPVLGEGGDADAGRRQDLGPADVVGQVQGLEHPEGEVVDGRHVREPREDRRRTRRRPSRATVSWRRTTARRRWATWQRSSSPVAWPQLSLTRLNRSRSTKKTVERSSARPARSISLRSRSSRARRLGRPVSASCHASRPDLLEQLGVLKGGDRLVGQGPEALLEPAVGPRVGRPVVEEVAPHHAQELVVGEEGAQHAVGDPAALQQVRQERVVGAALHHDGALGPHEGLDDRGVGGRAPRTPAGRRVGVGRRSAGPRGP